MLRIGVILLVVLGVMWVLDHILLRLERQGWINYRRRGLSRPGTAFHALYLESIFNPRAEHVIEAKYSQQREDAESGGPLGRESLDR